MALPAPNFREPVDGRARLVELLAGDRPNDFEHTLGLGWSRLALYSARCTSDGLTSREWFSHGDPPQVMLGVGRDDVLIAPAGPDASRFDPQQARGTLLTRGASGRDLAEVAAAVRSAAERERADRTWCRLCGTFKHPYQDGGDVCVDCTLLLDGTIE